MGNLKILSIDHQFISGVCLLMVIRENIIGSIFSKILVVCGFVMFILISYFSFRSTMSIYSSTFLLIAEILFFIFLIAILSFLVNRFFTTTQFLILLMIVGFIIRLLWIFYVRTMPSSDFLLMYNSAKQAVSGDVSFLSTGYFSSWIYQLGFTYYEALLIKLFGNHISILKLFNILFSLGTSLIIFSIAKKGFNEFSARTAALLYTFYIPNIIYSSVLTNQYISTFLFFLGLYFLVVKGLSAKYSWIFIGLLIGLGNIMRPLGSFYLLGIGVFVLIYKIWPLRKKESLNYTIKLIGICMIYLIVQQIVSYGLIFSGLSHKPLSNQEPYWKFAVGFNYQSNGAWNLKDQNFVSKFKLGEARNKAEISLIKERLQNKKMVAKLFVHKFTTFWGDPDASAYWSMGGHYKPSLQQSVTKYERLLFIASCFFALGTIFLIRKANLLASFLSILLGGYAAIHLMIEIQTRYRFDILPVLFILMGFGCYGFNQFVKKIRTRKLV